MLELNSGISQNCIVFSGTITIMKAKGVLVPIWYVLDLKKDQKGLLWNYMRSLLTNLLLILFKI